MNTKKLTIYILAAYIPMIAVVTAHYFLNKGIEPGTMNVKVIMSSLLTTVAMFSRDQCMISM